MIGGPTGFEGSERYQYSAETPEGRAVEAAKKLKASGVDRIVLGLSDGSTGQLTKPFPPGAPAIKAHEALKGVIARAGLDHCRQHTSGYGMAPGFPPSWGEPTNMFGGTKDVLQAGMVMTVEPAIFIKEEGLGVRLIDNCIITDSGIELLSVTPRDIAVVD